MAVATTLLAWIANKLRCIERKPTPATNSPSYTHLY